MNKKYFILYYISSILTLITLVIMVFNNIYAYDLLGYDYDFGIFISEHIFFSILVIINCIPFIIISILLLRKKKFYINSIKFPITYIMFEIFVLIIALLFDSRVVEECVHYMYYYSFILFDYLLLNIYTLFCLNKK